MDLKQKSINLHKKHKGKISIQSKISLKNKDDLSLAYTPGVAEVCKVIEKNSQQAYDLTSMKNTVAVVTDGSAVLGLGNIGGLASLPVMEGKAILFKEFGGVDAIPITINSLEVEKIVETIKLIAPTFGGINLEDIAAPRCFEIEERLRNELDIPVFHDDQDGTAIVVLAGLINALKLVGKNKDNTKIVINGSGAAGIAIARLLRDYGVGNIIVCDSKGIISKERDDLNQYKKELLNYTNLDNSSGTLEEAMDNTDVFVGVSVGGVLNFNMIKKMKKDPIVFAMANPIPEIMPNDALSAGARIVATGRSDFPNQLNNVLVFPGVFKGLLKARCQINNQMKISVAQVIADFVEKDLSEEKIIPSPFEYELYDVVAETIYKLSTSKND
ncbi:MAG: putative NAD-dependent malic enzyme 4 [Candidatus Dojkabacteria bacterium]|nr:MAG: putative NAD-dependent malic enzyme 4 [Candidatus Dojkabacteria bacterium]